ncbi:MAG: hypothetical protein ACRD9R_08240 [Pyrinomonadaceae bacterium]
MNKHIVSPVKEQSAEQFERRESIQPQPGSEKKPFVEPTVSVPVDVLEATTFFQGPTVDGADLS